ncbi:hypothetical protein BH11PLA2_BH11PLA2_21540 [soil metagenome]
MSEAADDYVYIGEELNLFANAVNWKSYYGRHVTPYLRGDVLEVGAGLGGTSRFLCKAGLKSWTGLEPDARLRSQLEGSLAKEPLPVPTTIIGGSTADLPPEPRYDALLYVDVIEHIEDDAGELARAAKLLRTGGVIVVLSPAHQWLYTPFDKAIGHFRRYNAARIRSICPPETRIERNRYLDSVGMLASLGNKLVLGASQPKLNQILLWDRRMVPLSRLIDPLTCYCIGKSILGIYRKQ